MDKRVEKAAEILKNGGIGIFPTDTAFGIGSRIDNEEAIRRLFTTRRRPETQATPVLVNSIEMAQKYVLPIPEDVKELMHKYWPGALTIILPCIVSKVPSLVRGGTDTLGVRIPNHPMISLLIEKIGVPILGPSANFHGEKTPYSFEDLDPGLVGKVDFVLEGECSIKQASTVLDCSQKPWKVIRQGAVRI